MMPLPLVDNPNIPESFADGIAGISVTNGTVTITFTKVRADHSQEPPVHRRFVTTRLSIPFVMTRDLQPALAQVLKQLEVAAATQGRFDSSLTIQ